jgi:hypothetical protein
MELPRTVKYRKRGADVEAHARAMHRYLRTGLLSRFDRQAERRRRTFGQAKVRLAKKAAGKAGLPRHGVVGPELFEAMWRADAYDAKAKALLAGYSRMLELQKDPRRKIVLAAARLYARNGEISYSQQRPTQYRPAPAVPSALDCSGYMTHIYREAGIKDDPNGYEPDYPMWGFTGTLWRTGRSISVSQLQPGDMIFYGMPWLAGAAAHVVVYRGGGRAYSMGSSSGPSEVAWNYRPVVGCRTFRLS